MNSRPGLFRNVLEHYVQALAARYRFSPNLMLQTASVMGYSTFNEPGELDFDQLLKSMNTGIVVTELMGQGVNTVTGDYSRGAAGFWVENGVVAQPVEEVTIAGNLRQMFAGIVAIGNDVDERGTIRSGSVLLDKMTIAGS